MRWLQPSQPLGPEQGVLASLLQLLRPRGSSLLKEKRRGTCVCHMRV